MFKNGFYFDDSFSVYPFFNEYGTAPLVGYVDPRTGEKVVYKKTFRKKSGKLPPTPLSLLYDSVIKEYDSRNGDLFRHDKNAAKKRIGDIKKILQESKEKAEEEFKNFIKDFDDDFLNDYVDQKEDDRLHARFARQKRFLRRGFFNRGRWDWFATFTWDGALYDTAEKWQNALLRFLGNTANRHDVKFLGAFETGDMGGRLHFHCLVSDPNGYFSDFKTKNTFSMKDRIYKNVKESVLMRKKFGINEFDKIDCSSNDEVRNTLLYCCYYAIQNDGRIYTSRGLPTSVLQFLDVTKECYYAGDEGVLKLLLRPDYEWDLTSFGKEGLPLRKVIVQEEKMIFRDVS